MSVAMRGWHCVIQLAFIGRVLNERNVKYPTVIRVSVKNRGLGGLIH